MSTAQRRRGKSLHLELPGGSQDEKPPLAALFLIQFDIKAGYTIAWKQCVPGLKLSDSVEYKSLPSGLHNVTDDLVYFVHDQEYAGISAFANRATDQQQERNALMLAVGALVPLDSGRLGRSWKHAEKLKALARELTLGPSKTKLLEDFWADNNVTEEPESSRSSTSRSPNRPGLARSRTRARSNGSGYGMPSLGLSSSHPALSLPTLIDSFGPLIYPLYKAALLRKRILLMHEAPVELACNFVYDISILSNIPSSVSDMIPLEPLPSRIIPLFSVGLHDIGALSQPAHPETDYGWIACSTDGVLAHKPQLYDVLVTIPPTHTQHASSKVWPTLQSAAGAPVLASQRDLRRFHTLRRSLRRWLPRSRSVSPYTSRTRILTGTSTHPTPTAAHAAADADRRSSLPGPEAFEDGDEDAGAGAGAAERLVEPLSWSALAYDSFLWWASAGERRADHELEAERDAALFRDFGTPPPGYPSADGGSSGGRRASAQVANGHGGSPERSRRRSVSPRVDTPGAGGAGAVMTDGTPAAPEMAVVAYFHRLTARILATLAQVVERADATAGEEAESADGPEPSDEQRERRPLRDGAGADAPVVVESEDVVRMGLDVWSEGDRRFVEELVDFYWGRKAEVQGGRVDCCGIRIL